MCASSDYLSRAVSSTVHNTIRKRAAVLPDLVTLLPLLVLFECTDSTAGDDIRRQGMLLHGHEQG